MKKWRYAAECLEEASVSATSQSPTTLRQVQEALGTAHDRAVLRDALRGFMRRHPEQPLEALIEELEAERQAAVQQFRELTAGLIPLPADAGPRPAVHRGATALWDEGERERLARWLTGRAGSEEPQERKRSLAPIGEPRKVRKFSERDR